MLKWYYGLIALDRKIGKVWLCYVCYNVYIIQGESNKTVTPLFYEIDTFNELFKSINCMDPDLVFMMNKNASGDKI